MTITNKQNNLEKWYTKPFTWLLIFVFLNLFAGIFIVSDYGESTDEVYERINAQTALKGYTSGEGLDIKEDFLSLPTILRYYGSAQTVVFETAEQNLKPILGTAPGTVRHYGYFVSFQVAVIAIYFLLTIFASKWVSLAVSLIFGTQPLLFGHAFINPKDIPLLAIFTATVAAGFHLSQRFESHINRYPFQLPRIDWDLVKVEIRRLSSKKTISGLVIISALLALSRIFAKQIATGLVTALFNSPENSPGGGILRLLAPNASIGEIHAYIQKGIILFIRSVNGISGILVVGLVGFLIIHLRKKGLIRNPIDATPVTKTTVQQHSLPFGLYLAIFGAGSLWGYAIATRVIGLTAGGIVGLCLLLEFRKKALLPLLVYVLSAGLICYAAWPYLWAFGFPGFIEALVVFSKFSDWGGSVLFEGQLFSPGTLPPYFMIKLIVLQLTLPVVLFSITGGIISLFELKNNAKSRIKILLLFAWFALPILYTVTRNTVQYNNFRQYLFILPPLFVFAGISIDWLVKKFRNRWITAAITILCTIPAIFSLVQLHPYQYIYYNALTGGVEGAFREYQLDYWLTSYMHAAEWIDENIPPGSSIMVWGGERRVKIFLENEFEFINPKHIPPEDYNKPDYVLVTTEYNLDLEYHANATPIFMIERDHVPLAIMMKNQP